MFTTNTLSTNKSSLNYLISLMPLSLILGNLAINLNIIIICILGILTFKFRLVEVNEKKILYIIYIFFFYLIFITLFRNLPNLDINPLYKNHIIKNNAKTVVIPTPTNKGTPPTTSTMKVIIIKLISLIIPQKRVEIFHF